MPRTRIERTLVAALAGLAALGAGAGIGPRPADAAGLDALGTDDGVPGTIGPRAVVPEDRYALAGGCYRVHAAGADADLARQGGTLAATAPAGTGEPLHFQATDLGRYLLLGTADDLLTADGTATTLGTAPGPAADWEIDALAGGGYSIRLSATGASLVAAPAGGALALVAGAATGADARFDFTLAPGCAAFPEAEVGITGPQVHGATPYEEVQGFLDAHLHITAFEFLGGAAHCGRPWHPYGITVALVDCPDHFVADGAGAVLENLLSTGDPVATHDPVGWPTFADWPAPGSLTHEQTYYRWLERAWRGGLRTVVNLFVENRVLCEIYPLGDNPCDEMASVRRQYQALRDLERYIDAQEGGPGEGWFRIVTTPYEARRVANEGRLAVVLGIEISEPFGCSEYLGVARCTTADIDADLDELQAMGVRQVFPIHKFDNALGGVTFDGGTKGTLINLGQLYGSGHFWSIEQCDPDDTGVHDNDQSLPTGSNQGTDLLGGILELFGPPVALPVYPAPHHCNTEGLRERGAYVIDGLMARGMFVDVDHMGVRSRLAALAQLEAAGYSGVVSSHSWATPDAYPRVLALGGVVTAYAGSSTSFVEAWRTHRARTDDRWYEGFGYGADANGLGAQGAPRGADAPDPVTYPFTGFGGTTVSQQVTGQRTYDVNVDGVAHYGLYPDWIEDLRHLAGDEIVTDLAHGSEAYFQMWERADGIAPAACRGPGALAGVRAGMTPEEVLRAAGQPQQRAGTRFTYCDGSIDFDAAGVVAAVALASAPAATTGPAGGGALPATGGSVPFVVAAGLAALALLGRGLARR